MKNFLLIIFILSFMGRGKINASETDQFYAKNAVIRESGDAINQFFATQIQRAINEANESRKGWECREVALEVLDQVLGKINLKDYYHQHSFSKISYYTQHSPLVDRFPTDSISDGEYRLGSIYENRPFPTNVVNLARTININNVYMGTDKIGHFSILGRWYYKSFLKNLKRGMTEAAAEKEAVRNGIKDEINFLGYKSGGTFSYGDLDANYQGLLFGRNLCEGKEPYLINSNGVWGKNPRREFDIREYVTPKLDEAYNVSLWTRRFWKKMQREIIRDYCENKNNQSYLKRLKYYESIDVRNRNDDYLDEFVKGNQKFDRKNQLLNDEKIKCL